MAIVEFNHTVKHGGVFYAPHAPVEVSDVELEALVKSGAKVLPQNREEPKSATQIKPEPVVSKRTNKPSSPTKKG